MMFDIKTVANIKHLNVRTETHGDELVPAVDIKMMLVEVPVDKITSAIPGIAKRFYEGDVVAVGEVNPLTVYHKLENLFVKIGDHEIDGADIKKNMKVQLLPNKVANIELAIQTEHRNDLAIYIMGLLKQEITVEICERQADLTEDVEQQ